MTYHRAGTLISPAFEISCCFSLPPIQVGSDSEDPAIRLTHRTNLSYVNYQRDSSRRKAESGRGTSIQWLTHHPDGRGSRLKGKFPTENTVCTIGTGQLMMRSMSPSSNRVRPVMVTCCPEGHAAILVSGLMCSSRPLPTRCGPLI